MSEREEIFLTRAEKVLDDLEGTRKSMEAAFEKSRGWYKKMTNTFAVLIITVVFGAGGIGYKIGAMDRAISDKANTETVKLLVESNEATVKATKDLVTDRDHLRVASDILEYYKIVNSNIFTFTTSRGAIKEVKK